MKSLKDYPISFGYNATTTINGKPYTHKGSDRAAPTGTPIVIGSTTIGLTGNTGLSTGPHCHLQAGRDEWAQQTINPDPYWFKAGTVYSTGYGDQWGNYICIKVGDVYVYYCHLSKINVKKGQVIGGGKTMNPAGLNVLSQLAWNKPASDKFKKDYNGKDVNKTLTDVLNSAANKQMRTKAANYDKHLSAAYKVIDELKKSGDIDKAALNKVYNDLGKIIKGE